jgi:hypothetical protein
MVQVRALGAGAQSLRRPARAPDCGRRALPHARAHAAAARAAARCTASRCAGATTPACFRRRPRCAPRCCSAQSCWPLSSRSRRAASGARWRGSWSSRRCTSRGTRSAFSRCGRGGAAACAPAEPPRCLPPRARASRCPAESRAALPRLPLSFVGPAPQGAQGQAQVWATSPALREALGAQAAAAAVQVGELDANFDGRPDAIHLTLRVAGAAPVHSVKLLLQFSYALQVGLGGGCGHGARPACLACLGSPAPRSRAAAHPGPAAPARPRPPRASGCTHSRTCTRRRRCRVRG